MTSMESTPNYKIQSCGACVVSDTDSAWFPFGAVLGDWSGLRHSGVAMTVMSPIHQCIAFVCSEASSYRSYDSGAGADMRNGRALHEAASSGGPDSQTAGCAEDAFRENR